MNISTTELETRVADARQRAQAAGLDDVSNFLLFAQNTIEADEKALLSYGVFTQRLRTILAQRASRDRVLGDIEAELGQLAISLAAL